MSNPTPRPALRKADDAEVHPAAPRPARSPRRAAVPAPSPAPAPEAAAAPAAEEPAPRPAAPKTKAKRRYETPPAVPVAVKKRARKDFAGTTSDHLRPADAPTAAHDELHDAKKPKKGKKADDLMSGGTGKLTVVVPKKLRKAAEKEAARRGLDVDAVVADLLHAWLTGRR
jgi:hypothetical protein